MTLVAKFAFYEGLNLELRERERPRPHYLINLGKFGCAGVGLIMVLNAVKDCSASSSIWIEVRWSVINDKTEKKAKL